jgi:hypothetical protein
MQAVSLLDRAQRTGSSGSMHCSASATPGRQARPCRRHLDWIGGLLERLLRNAGMEHDVAHLLTSPAGLADSSAELVDRFT